MSGSDAPLRAASAFSLFPDIGRCGCYVRSGAISRPPPNMSDSRFFAESHFPVADQEARLGFSFGEWRTSTRARWKIGDVKSPTLAPPASRRKNKIAGQPLCTQHQEP